MRFFLSFIAVAVALHAPPLAPQRCPSVTMMGRAERRAAAKKNKKSGGSKTAVKKPLSASTKASSDKLPRSVVEKRLREIPVFGILQEGQGWVQQGGDSIFYLDEREASRIAGANPEYRVEGVALDTVYFDQSCRLKASEEALREAQSIPASRALTREIYAPLFCIDGFQTTDKDTGVNSLPLFLSRADLMEFAQPVYGEKEAAEKVLITDLSVVVENMLRGPAGLLKDGRFFACAKALRAMDELVAQGYGGGAQALFPDAGGVSPGPPGRGQSSQDKGLFTPPIDVEAEITPVEPPKERKVEEKKEKSAAGNLFEGLFPGGGGGGLFPGA